MRRSNERVRGPRCFRGCRVHGCSLTTVTVPLHEGAAERDSLLYPDGLWKCAQPGVVTSGRSSITQRRLPPSTRGRLSATAYFAQADSGSALGRGWSRAAVTR